MIVGRVRHGLADVPFHTASSEHRPGHTKGDGICRGQNPDTLGTPDPDAVLREQSFVFNDARFKILAEPFNILLERVIGLVLQPADAERMRGQARPAVLFKNLQDFFTLAEAIEERSKCTNVQSMSAEPQEVAGDPLQLRQNRSNHARARWSFHNQQFFHCLAISQAAADSRDIVHAVDVRSKLLIRAVLCDFLNAPVQISDDALRADDTLSIELQLDAQHAVRGRMLRPHVDDQLIRAQ